MQHSTDCPGGSFEECGALSYCLANLSTLVFPSFSPEVLAPEIQCLCPLRLSLVGTFSSTKERIESEAEVLRSRDRCLSEESAECAVSVWAVSSTSLLKPSWISVHSHLKGAAGAALQASDRVHAVALRLQRGPLQKEKSSTLRSAYG